MSVALIDTGVANTASMDAGLRRAGASVTRTVAPLLIEEAPFVVLPGVGSFGAGMAALRDAGLVGPLRRRLAAGRPTLAVCLGMQLLAEASEEAPGVAGLDWLPGTVRRLPPDVRTPHLGWNGVEVDMAGEGPLASGVACFAHSYALTGPLAADQCAWTTHGPRFLAAVARGRVLACQFHPELSGLWGGELLRRWLSGEPALTSASVPPGLRPRIVPCLDVRDGRVVKGVQFQGLRDAGDPAQLAAAYCAQGADELVLLDVSATPEGRATAAETVARVRSVLSVPLTVGGGVRAVADAERLLLAGADKVAVNTAAVARPAILGELADRFGQQCVVLALDAARTETGWSVVVRSGTDRRPIDAVDWARRAVDAGAGEILLTSWDRDGTRRGYDLELLAAVSQAVSVPVVASGGADGPDHLAAGLNAGADAVLAASIFHDGDWTVDRIKHALAARGLSMRLPLELGDPMIIPSIDIRGGRAVQLVGGREQALDGGAPLDVAARFSIAGELAVIDLDAALGTGDNTAIIEQLVRRYPCRVGGGIRSVAAAQDWLDRGARRVILGTAARPEVLSQLPRDRVIAALDAVHGEVVVEGWRTRTGESIADRLDRLQPFVSGFLITFVEHEGRLGGTAMERVQPLVTAAGSARVTIAGGVTTPQEVRALDRLGADAQVGMALYTGRLSLGDAVGAVLDSDRPDGLWPTMVCDRDGVALGLCWSDADSLREAIETGRGIYRSRRRGRWVKGEQSGDTQVLHRVEVDCDRDALRFTVTQHGRGFCHRGTRDCFDDRDRGLGALQRTLAHRRTQAPTGSYAARLFADSALLAAKLREEAGELAAAETQAEVTHEAADLLFFASVAMARAGVDLADVARELDRRQSRVRRRAGNAKPPAPSGVPQ